MNDTVFVKICGLANEEDVIRTATLRPDALGFIFWEGSKRHVEAKDVAKWTHDLPKGLLKVGVFVNEKPARMAAVVKTAKLDIVQLHGKESVEEPAVPEEVRVWKVIRSKSGVSPIISSFYDENIEAFLFDSGTQDMPGGTGELSDWEVAKKMVQKLEKPVLLAGGLNPGNVQEAVRQVRPWGVDVSSGVEARVGKKDMMKVKAFIELSKNA